MSKPKPKPKDYTGRGIRRELSGKKQKRADYVTIWGADIRRACDKFLISRGHRVGGLADFNHPRQKIGLPKDET